MRKIFILGVGRTGSKFYMQLLNTHKDIYISPELIFRHPIKKDFHAILDKAINKNESVELIVSRLFDFKERLPYIKTIHKIGKKKLTYELNKIDCLTPYKVFDCIIKLSAEIEKKSRYGAKFPIHFKYSQKLIEFYNNPKIFYLIRDPRAIYASDLRKKTKESKTEHYRFRVKYFLRFFVLIYTIFEWRTSLIFYEKCKRKYGSDIVELFYYEDILKDSKSVIGKISSFINCNFDDFNLERVKIVDSSYSGGVSADRWRKSISKSEILLFKIVLGGKMKKYGYH